MQLTGTQVDQQLQPEGADAAGMTQTEVAEKPGRPQSYIAKVEGEERRLDVIELVELGDTIELDLDATLSDELRRV
ncbi:MAG: helix-turn-helix transcriptional regulator [Devosia sp.]|nr:helix-turn-helix transcriptional regulator [Devosia sp.]